MRIANKDSATAVLRQVEFTGSNLFGEHRNGSYAVYSYGYHFPIYALIGGLWYGNEDKYSVSTSKQQSQANPGCVDRWVDTGTLKKLIREA